MEYLQKFKCGQISLAGNIFFALQYCSWFLKHRYVQKTKYIIPKQLLCNIFLQTLKKCLNSVICKD